MFHACTRIITSVFTAETFVVRVALRRQSVLELNVGRVEVMPAGPLWLRPKTWVGRCCIISLLSAQHTAHHSATNFHSPTFNSHTAVCSSYSSEAAAPTLSSIKPLPHFMIRLIALSVGGTASQWRLVRDNRLHCNCNRVPFILQWARVLPLCIAHCMFGSESVGLKYILRQLQVSVIYAVTLH